MDIPKPGSSEIYGFASGPAAFPNDVRMKNWAYNLAPYIKNTQIFACPSGKPIWKPANSTDNAGYIYSNWIADGGIGPSGTPPIPHPAITQAQIPRVAETVLIWETGKACSPIEFMGWNGAFGDCNAHSDFNPNGTCPKCYDNWVAPHMDGRNYVFADGHAKWFKDSQMYIAVKPQYWRPSCQQ